MNADSLVLASDNEKKEYDTVVLAVRLLINTIDRTASRVAKANADWHDDPSADDHELFHSPAYVQFPSHVRKKAIKKLVSYYLDTLMEA